MSLKKMVMVACLALAAQVQVHAALPTAGTLVVVRATGSVTVANDEVTVVFESLHEDKDKALAASRVNQKMRQGIDIIKREDPSAKLKTANYMTHPLHAETRAQAAGMPAVKPVIIGWRVSQDVRVTTTKLANLPKLVAAVQKVLGLDGLSFGLAPETRKALDEQRIAATYQNLNERVASIAGAMGRKVSDAVLEEADFEGAGNQTFQRVEVTGSRISKRDIEMAMAEPSFEAGETTVEMHLVGKVKFK